MRDGVAQWYLPGHYDCRQWARKFLVDLCKRVGEDETTIAGERPDYATADLDNRCGAIKVIDKLHGGNTCNGGFGACGREHDG